MDSNFSLESEANDNVERIQAAGRFWPERIVLLRRRGLEKNSNSQAMTRAPRRDDETQLYKCLRHLTDTSSEEQLFLADPLIFTCADKNRPQVRSLASVCNGPDKSYQSGCGAFLLNKNERLIDEQAVVAREAII